MSAFLQNPNLRFILFGGKGGTGKTTSAAATALHFARQWPARKVLLVSTDPAHSLSDSLDCPVGSTVSGVAGVDNLFALALDAKTLLAQSKRQYGAVITLIADRGTYLDKEDIAGFLDLSLPGIDELMAILKIMELMHAEQYDLVILDTAPTGHTIRLLALPEQMEHWIHVMDMMLEKHRFIARSFAHRYVPDQADAFLEALSNDVQRLRDLLKDRDSTEFVPVVNAEGMSILETEMLLQTLDAGSIPVKTVIVNRLVAARVGEDGTACPFCQARARDQAPYQRAIATKFSAYNLALMPLFPTEIRGMTALSAYAALLFGENPEDRWAPTVPAADADHPPCAEGVTQSVNQAGLVAPQTTSPARRTANQSGGLAGGVPGTFADAGLRGLLGQDLQFILFGGKGGVGKTTIAAASAIELARRNPGAKTLIFSTDPTSGLADSLACVIGDQPTPVAGITGLYAMQIDAAARLEALKQIYTDAIEGVFDDFLGGGNITPVFDREIMLELVSMIPPGIDEMMALLAMIELIDDGSYARFVLDTAPTGHLLRLLEMPRLASDWFRKLSHLLLKYQGTAAMAKTMRLLMETSKGVKKLRALLSDPQRSEFVVVTIAEAMGVLETERLLAALNELHVPCHHLVVNMIIPPTTCTFCRSKRAEQQAYVARLRHQYAAYTVSEAPLFPHDVRGVAELGALARILFG
jgi:arsenite-transporting ATPase